MMIPPILVFNYKRYLLYGDVIYAIVKSYSFVTKGVKPTPHMGVSLTLEVRAR